MISEGQRNDINYAIPLLDQIEINGSNVLADRGYDSNKLLDYVYARGGEPTIPSRKGATRASSVTVQHPALMV